jgi:hypothetical protein
MPAITAVKEAEEKLAGALLPQDPAEIRQLTESEQILVQGYLVLACGHIEEFFEQCFLDYVAVSLKSAGPGFDGCFLSLAVKFSDDLRGQLGHHPRAAVAAPVLVGLYQSKVVRPNNGMKRKNLEAMAKPLGLLRGLEDECEALLGPADLLGGRRGAAAHAPTIREEIQPSQARRLVSDVIDEVPSLIALLDQSAS